MGFVHIAFIECVLDTSWRPMKFSGSDERNYETSVDNAGISLVDLGLTRRYYSFRTNSTVVITNNVLIFRDDYGTLEASVDESKQFPSKSKMTD